MLMSRKRIPDAIPLRPNLFGYGHSTLATEWWMASFRIAGDSWDHIKTTNLQVLLYYIRRLPIF